MDKKRNNYAWPVTSIDYEDLAEFNKWFANNKSMFEKRKLFIWGAGIRGTIVSTLLEKRGINQFVFIDTNEEKWNGYIDEHVIISPEMFYSIGEIGEKYVLISCENYENIEAVLKERGFNYLEDYSYINNNQYELYLEEFCRNMTPDYLVMGDCMFSTISLFEKDQSCLRDKLYEAIGYERLKVLAMHGMGMRAFYHVFDSQLRMQMKPRILLLMVNFDTLTGRQHLLPRSQHASLMKMLLNVQSDATEEFKEYVKISEERSTNLQMEFFVGEEERGVSLDDLKAKNYLKLNYMYNLDPNTEGIVYLKKILKKALSENIKVIPFIPPINYQLADRLIGERFVNRYMNNVKIIKDIVTQYGYNIIDLSFSLQMNQFTAPNNPSETANSSGRNLITNIFVDKLNQVNDVKEKLV